MCPSCSFRKICDRDDEQVAECIIEDPDALETRLNEYDESEFKVGKSTRKLVKHILRALDKGINVGIVRSFPAEKQNNLFNIGVKKGSRKDRRAAKNSYSSIAHLYTSNNALLSMLADAELNVNMNVNINEIPDPDIQGVNTPF